MERRKGQVTIFVILGIIIVVSVLFFVYFLGLKKTDKVIEKTVDFKSKSEKAEYYMMTCISENANKMTYYFVNNSFLFDLPEEAYVYKNGKKIPLLVDGSKSYLKSIDESEKKFSEELNFLVKQCFSSFIAESMSDYQVNASEPTSIVSFGQEAVIIDFNYSIMLQKKDFKFEKNQFTYRVEYDLKSKHDFLKNISDRQIATPNYFQIGFIAEQAHKKEILLSMTYLGEKTSVIMLTYAFNEEYINPVFAIR